MKQEKKHTWKKDDEIEALHNLKYNIQYSRNEWHPYYDIREIQKRKKHITKSMRTNLLT